MNTMTWDLILRAIVLYGIPLTTDLLERWSRNEPVTLEDFNKARALATQTAQDRMRLRLVANGIDPESEQGKMLLSLAG